MTAEPRDFLAHALALARARLVEAEALVSLSTLDARIWNMPPARSLEAALRGAERIHLIAEMKRASPSAGRLAPAYDPGGLARTFAAGGAEVISVLTEPEAHEGDLAHLAQAGGAGLPVLRRDFLVSPYQVAESRVAGADAVLLVVAALGEVGLRHMLQAAGRYGVAAIVEIHDEEDLDMAAGCGARIIGVSARDLRTQKVDADRWTRFASSLPRDAIRVAGGGIATPEQVRSLRALRYDAVVVGEALMRSPDPAAFLTDLVAAGV